MKLTDFIRDNHPVIIKEWETFAATLRPAAEAMSNAALRDHADEILTAIVADMESPQDRGEQADKVAVRASGVRSNSDDRRRWSIGPS